MRLKEYINNLTGGVSELFDLENINQYPAPFDTAAVALMIASNAVRDYGSLKILNDVEESTLEEVKTYVKNGLLGLQFTLSTYNRILENTLEDYETVPDEREVRTYGEKETTLNTGARSTSQTLGATHGQVVDSGTAYDTVTGKEESRSVSDTDSVTNGTSSTASEDVNTESEHIDTIEKYKNIDAESAPDVIAKWVKISSAPLMLMYEKAFVDILTAPIFE